MLYCYTCHLPSPSYTCPHCGGEDVEPFDTDGNCDRVAEERAEALASYRYEAAHPRD